MVPVRARRALAAVTAAALLAVLTACGGSDAGSPARKGTDWSPAPRSIDGLRVLTQSDTRGLRLHTSSGDKTFLPGINLGSTTPGHQPGEVGTITAPTYRRWFAQMGDLGIRVVRIYTLHPPAFYAELARYNTAHRDAPLYLVQGVYLPDETYNEPGRSLYTPAIDQGFTRELADASGAVHGDLQRAAAPGRAGGTWTTDVSPWLAGWIVGVEWDPAGVQQTDRLTAAAYSPGRYFAATPTATPTERWIARHMDGLAAAEAGRGVSAPIAFANWPTADPLRHPTEPNPTEDLVSVDAAHVLPTAAWPGGTFASFHAYPYYPDFQRYEAGYDAETWDGQPDRYAGYLVALEQHFAPTMPLVVSEFGVPSSLGSAHAGTNGRDQGGHSEREAMAMDASMMRMMADKGLSGAFVFSWEDEWFKRTWNTQDHQDPERRQLWHDPLTNEQYFGVVATDPGKIPDAAVEVTPTSGEIEYAYVWADHSWVHVEVTGRTRTPDRLDVAADVLPQLAGPDYRVALDRSADTGEASVRAELDPIRLDTSQQPYRPDAAQPWHRFELLTNRAYGAKPAEYQPVGDLRRGSWDPRSQDFDSTSTWSVDNAHRTLRLRLPWSMLGIADPSQKLALGPGRPAAMVPVTGIGLDLDADGTTQHLDLTWPTWTRVSYTPRLKAGIGTLESAYRSLAP
jgi:hypothetical protein